MKYLFISLVVVVLLLSLLVMVKMVVVVVSFFILGDIVQQVGGEYVNVVILVGLNGDLYGFEFMLKNSK